MDTDHIRSFARALRLDAYRERLGELRPPVAAWARLMASVQRIEARAREQGHLELADELAAALQDSIRFWHCDDVAEVFPELGA